MFARMLGFQDRKCVRVARLQFARVAGFLQGLQDCKCVRVQDCKFVRLAAL